MQNLDKEQALAAGHAGGPAIVIAGPGAGKTRTLVAHYLRRVEAGVAPDSILVATFTAKAADQLRIRIIEELGGVSPEVGRRMAIGTFHSLCARMLRRYHAAVHLPAKFEILDTAGQNALLHSLGIKWEGAEAGDLVDVIGRWKDLCKTPSEAASDAAMRSDRALGEAAVHYATYNAELARRGQVDFADLIGKMIEAMRSEPAIRRVIQGRFSHLLIDEWQDVNALQVTFLKYIISRSRNIFCVGDDDQAIYGWRGADVRYTTDFSRHFPNAMMYRLGTNWRSDPAIVASSSAFVATNQMRVRKNLISARPKGVADAVTIREFATDVEEAEWIANSCRTILGRGAATSDLAVLFRTASLSPVLERAFKKAGVAATVQSATRFWDLQETLGVVGLICMAENPGDKEFLDLSFKGGRRRQELEAWAANMHGSPMKQLAPSAARAIEEFPPPGLTAERLGLWLDSAEQAANEALRFSTAKEFGDYVRAQRAAPRESGDGGIPLMSIHASKGLEWQGVFVCGCESHMMPHHRTNNVEEERRVLYVAMTRARAFLSMSYARHRFAKGQGPSDFLHEIADRTHPQAAQVIWQDRPARPSHMNERSGTR
jgi:DNA helicase-2/ATP-dependent DNA helicase PcrA